MVLALAGAALAQTRPVAPQLESNPGATYNLYLNFSGFDYRSVANFYNNANHTGQWGFTGRSPGIVPAFDTDGDGSSFSSAEQQTIRDTWARFTNAFTGFNINVTTVDPAAGLPDNQRQAAYDQKQYFTQTVFGGTYNWFGVSGGVSYVGTAQNANTFSGGHVNWVFPVNGSGTSAKGMAAAGIHEDGHALGLGHQHNETTGGEYSNNNNASGNGSYAPIMGTTYISQRGTWRQGDPTKNGNDVAMLQSNADMGPLLDDGIGHSFLTATALAVTESGIVDVNSSKTKGFIMPKASTNYSAVGEDSYTKDYFSFTTVGGMVTLVANDGNDRLQAGVADPGATMRSILRIYNSAGSLLATATEDATTLRHTFMGNLDSGSYYAEISSYGAYVSSYEPNSRYFNMGGYFLSGSGFTAAPVPEPASMIALGLGIAAFVRRRKSA